MRFLRFYKINKVALEYGLDKLIPDHWLPWYAKLGRSGFFWLRNKHPDQSMGARIRLALEELGPVFIKFGQMLSTRRDLLPPKIADELALLQDRVPPFDSQRATRIILESLGIDEMTQLFSEFDAKPMASASIAQVHSAVLADSGEQVVIKVIRPDIEDTIHADIDLMRTLAQAVQTWLPDGKRLRPVEVVEEYQRTIIDELDLLREAANGTQLKNNFLDSPALYVPHIYMDYCSKDVMVMERIDGIPISDVDALIAQNTNLKILAERGVELFFTQVFRDSFFHADMHPGNIFVSREHPHDPQYIGIDFGIVGTLNKDDKHYLAENFIAFFNRDYRKVAELHVDSGWVPSDTNIDDFETAIRSVCEPIFQKPLAEISFGHVLLQLFNTARRFNMTVQPQLVLLQKTLLYVEGLGRQLYPQLDLWQTAKPFLENWMKEQVGPKAVYKKVKANLPYWSEKLPEMPDLIHDSLRQVKLLPELQRQHFARQEARSIKAQKSTFYTLVGSTLMILAAIFTVSDGDMWLVGGAATAGVLAWFRGWQGTH